MPFLSAVVKAVGDLIHTLRAQLASHLAIGSHDLLLLGGGRAQGDAALIAQDGDALRLDGGEVDRTDPAPLDVAQPCRPIEGGFAEVGPAVEPRSAEVSPLQPRQAKIGSLEVCKREVSLCKARTAKVSVLKVHTTEVGSFQARPAEISSLQMEVSG